MPAPTDTARYVLNCGGDWESKQQPAQLVRGSHNGHYLEDFHSAKGLDDLRERLNEWMFYNDDAVDRLREEDVSKSWLNKVINQRLDFMANTSTWMKETWGGPIRGKKRPGDRRWYVNDLVDPEMEMVTVKSGVAREFKRSSSSSGASSRPNKKLKKQHKIFTAPREEREALARADKASEESDSIDFQAILSDCNRKQLDSLFEDPDHALDDDDDEDEDDADDIATKEGQLAMHSSRQAARIIRLTGNVKIWHFRPTFTGRGIEYGIGALGEDDTFISAESSFLEDEA